MLSLSGTIKIFHKETFTNVRHIVNLYIDTFTSLSIFSDTALQSLRNLAILKMNNVNTGVGKSLDILKPLSGKNMTFITFSRVSFSQHDGYSSLYNNEGVLNSDKTKYLVKICVREFSSVSSTIFAVAPDAFS